tara:strand:+ start:1183 stop:2082 length:900 start_codon:yes stop_codon:yes gene_type:complete
MKKQLFINTILLTLSIALLVSCGQSETDQQEQNSSAATAEIDSSNVMMNIGGSIFSIPSPIQSTMLMSQVGAEFNGNMLNPKENVDNYSSDFLKAVNLGVYGCDLGYTAAYENNDLSLKYLATIRNLAADIDLENAFDENLIERFSNNFSNRDSMFVLVSQAYKGADNYLKENDKDDVAALVLAGGWIEANYLSSILIKETKNQEISLRLIEQKNALHTLINMLEQLGSNDDYWDLSAELEELYHLYDSVEYTTTYVPSVTDFENKTTTIKSKREINVTDDQLSAIVEKLVLIRNEIIQ